MSPPSLAVAASRFPGPLRKTVQLASSTGAAGLQFDARQQLRPADLSSTGRRELLHVLEEMNLRIASLTFPLRRPLHDEDHLEARVTALKQAMQFAWDLKSRVVSCRIGRVVEDKVSPAAIRQKEVLSELARHGNHVGVVLSIIPSGDTTGELASLLHSIDEGPLGVDFDPAERIMSRQDCVASLRDLHPVITHVTGRDALRDADGSGMETVIGRGEVPWEELLATLDEMNYAGWLTIDRRGGESPLEEMTKAVKYLNRVMSR